MTTGQLYIISAPSGSGKTSLIKALRQQLDRTTLAVSHTTRPARAGEIDGQHYHFVSLDEFAAMRQQNAFLECAEVFGNHYGTSKAAADSAQQQGNDVILEIDWQGATQVRAIAPDVIWIFILPPSIAALETRLQARGSDNAATIARRLNEAPTEIRAANQADFLIVNQDFDTALTQLQAIFIAERQRQRRMHAAHTSLLNLLQH